MHLPVSRTRAGVLASIRLAGLLARRSAARGCPARRPAPAARSPRLRSQVWQSPSCSESSSSTTVRRASRTLPVLVLHLHALGRRHGAGGDQRSRALHLDDADAAGADGLHVLRGSRAWGCACRPSGRPEGSWCPRDFDRRCCRWSGLASFSASLLTSSTCRSRSAGSAWPRDGHLAAQRLLDLVEVRPRRSTGAHRPLAAACSTGSASGSNEASAPRARAPEGVVRAGQVLVDADGRPLAGATASTTDDGPVTASPPAKIHFSEVWPVDGSAVK